MANLIKEIPSFNQDLIRPGFLIILTDYHERMIGSGIVISSSPIELKLKLWTTDNTGGEFDLPFLVDYDLTIGSVLDNEVRVKVIDPEYPFSNDNRS